MPFYIYVVTKVAKEYKIQEIPITPDVDVQVLKARRVDNYISHFITHTPPSDIIAEMNKYFKGLTFL